MPYLTPDNSGRIQVLSLVSFIRHTYLNIFLYVRGRNSSLIVESK